ncbi:MAG: hypothetical protein Ct9H90mP9_1240 [Pseudomonadota bacterium]|nr:MAG: hypothetical protein Ct9H90mP9_1240 [Pseudomonadota bacterium]
MSVMEWNRLRAPQLRALAQEDCLVILPVGSTEQHGPHLPVQVDALLATEVSLGAASRFNPPGKAIVAPRFGAGLRNIIWISEGRSPWIIQPIMP